MRSRLLTAALLSLLCLTACETSTTPSGTGTASAKPTSTEADTTPSDGGWTLDSATFKDDGLGDFSGTARIINDEDGERTGVFTITLFKGSKQVASLQGSANDVEKGRTVTVQLVSTDKYVAGPYRTEFQSDI